MTIIELHRAVRLGLDKTDALNLPSFTTQEIDHWLNVAQERFVNTRYNLNNIYKAGFEHIQKRVDDLRLIVKEQSLEVTEDKIAILPEDYRFLVRLDLMGESEDCPAYRVEVKQIQHDDLNKLLRDPFNRPTDRDCLYLFTEQGIKLYTEADIKSCVITYVHNPRKMSYADNVTCELAEHTHQEIVNITVELLLENIESQRRPDINYE